MDCTSSLENFNRHIIDGKLYESIKCVCGFKMKPFEKYINVYMLEDGDDKHNILHSSFNSNYPEHLYRYEYLCGNCGTRITTHMGGLKK